jgi:hypothetical protein
MRLWPRKVRKANIPDSDRDIFERYGEFVIGSVLAGGLSPRAKDLLPLYGDAAKWDHARDWLTERSDIHENRERRLELLEWGVLVFVFVGVIVDALLFFHH